ncbi:response regulator transcription factor [Streptomyces sp. NPDC002888]|uniref:response regulator transcription factor n=1 Tax=Streptomyces sp. NPDC002888 TaxID=3364668 RepID=UPI0036A50D88
MAAVLIADPQALQRLGLPVSLESHPALIAAGQAKAGLESLCTTVELRPGVVLMSLRLPGTDGIEITRWIVASSRRHLCRS